VSKEIAKVSKGKLIPYFSSPGALIADNNVSIEGQVICETAEIRLLGQHNWQNVCAAVTTTWQVTKDIEPIRQAITNFSGLEYRLEFIKDVNGVKYYNDSFGTTPETAMVAVDSFSEPKVIILGGSDKGADFSELAKKIVHSNVKQVITIGQMGPIIASKLRELGYNDITVGANNMPEIVGQASKLASSGDIVLLSTACASFGMFKNYKDRGDQFNEAVLGLA
jgi:UDP-N-acetylmuramoylalanine--D-glutamate ligase